MAAKLTVSWNLTVVYMLYISFREFSHFIILSFRWFKELYWYHFLLLFYFCSIFFCADFILFLLLFSFHMCITRAVHGLGNARQTMKWKPIADLCRELKILISPSNYSKELTAHTRNDCSAAYKTKRRSERRTNNKMFYKMLNWLLTKLNSRVFLCCIDIYFLCYLYIF